jgi:hypothetical protein
VGVLQLKQEVRCSRRDLAVPITKLVDQQPKKVRLLLRLLLEKTIDKVKRAGTGVLDLV